MSQIEYSPGLEGVIAGVTAISHVDAENRRLIYRGYNVHDLAERSTYEEVAYLLLMGKLPAQRELDSFTRKLVAYRSLPSLFFDIFAKISSTVHPMDTLRTAVSVLALDDPDVAVNTHEANLEKAIRLTARIPTIIAAAHRIANKKAPIAPDLSLSHAEDFLYMLNGWRPDSFAAKVFDASLIIYAEHGYNASTFAARVTASTLSDIYSAVVAAIGALKGPLHGGANEQAMAMLREIGD
ncbi:MAG: citrate synthase, partial [Candidatus Latescibacteria bacterium]|nr:citrate synthase [Candidatus Latescibacterota bacterium]